MYLWPAGGPMPISAPASSRVSSDKLAIRAVSEFRYFNLRSKYRVGQRMTWIR